MLHFGPLSLAEVPRWRASPPRTRIPEANIRSAPRLSQRIVSHLQDWYQNNRKGVSRLVFRYIGADYVELTKKVLSDFKFPGVVYVYIGGKVNPNNLKELSRQFNEDANSSVRVFDGQNPINEDYDVMICTHYWQHHSAYALDEELNKSKLKLHGMLIWLAATSRSGKRDEYVCEGCFPMLASVYSSQKDAPSNNIPYTVMGEYVEGFRYISYAQISSYRPHIFVLAWGFPKVLAIPIHVCDNDLRLQSFLLDYFNWGKGTEAVTSFIESRPGMVEKMTDVNVKILGIDVRKRIRRKDVANSYILLLLKYQISNEYKELPFIAIQGRDKNEWDIALREGETSIVLHPALCLASEKILNINSIEEIGRSVIEEIINDAGRGEYINEYRNYIVDSLTNGCVGDERGKAWRIEARIKDVALNDFIVVAMDSENTGGITGVEVYYSFLPTRRYLTENDFNLGLKRLDRFDMWKERLPSDCSFSFVPRRTDSYTWLWSYKHFVDFCKNHGLVIPRPDDDVYFHKSYGRLTDKAKSAFHDVPLIESSESLNSNICSMKKDEDFNALPLDVRLKLLGCMNIYDMLVFAEKRV